MNSLHEVEAAESLFRTLVESGKGTGTAIVAAAALAGTQLIRNTGIPFEGIEPGAYVLIDILNDQGIELLNHLDARLSAMAPDPIGDWNLPELAGTGPAESVLELVKAYEGPFLASCWAPEIAAARRPFVALETAALLIHRASPVMDAEVGKSIVAQVLVQTVKSVPPPIVEQQGT